MGKKWISSLLIMCMAVTLSAFPTEASWHRQLHQTTQEALPYEMPGIPTPSSIPTESGSDGEGEQSIDASLRQLPKVDETELSERKNGQIWTAGLVGLGAGVVLCLLAAMIVRIVLKTRKQMFQERGEEVLKSENTAKIASNQEKLLRTEIEQPLNSPAPTFEQSNHNYTGNLKTPGFPEPSKGTLGKVHHIGRRRNQQDTLSVMHTRIGLLAVVSDGMGGLSDGEKVSQRAVQGMLQAAGTVKAQDSENPLFMMLSEANEQVLRMLGPNQIYKSGATLLAILVNAGCFHWVAVGDSRIYLYCKSHLIQINREHIYKQQLIHEAVNKDISFSRAASDPQKDRLISFLGMGELKYVDGSLRPVDLRQGDKLLLMSDGIFNTISEPEIIRILENTENAAAAAALMEHQILAANNPSQDNFTCVILDF